MELGWVFKFRWEAWEEILSLTVVWVRMDMDLVVVESLQSWFITDGGLRGEAILGDVVVPFGGRWWKVKSSIGVRPS